MTLYGWGNPRYFPRLPPAVVRYFDVAGDARVLAHCHWHTRLWERLTLILLHGLNGSSEAHYMRGIAEKAFARGMNVVRLNQRNCGGTEHLSAGLFHSGLTADAKHVIEELTTVDGIERIALAGYSLGGNLALKLAGEYADASPASLVGVAAVSPILEISQCVLALERKENWLYQWNFVRDLKKRIRRKEQLRPGRFDLSRLAEVRTVRDFDEAIRVEEAQGAEVTRIHVRAGEQRRDAGAERGELLLVVGKCLDKLRERVDQEPEQYGPAHDGECQGEDRGGAAGESAAHEPLHHRRQALGHDDGHHEHRQHRRERLQREHDDRHSCCAEEETQQGCSGDHGRVRRR